MRNTAAEKAKVKAAYACQECGSKELIHTHHEIPGDDESIVVLCAHCHAKKHPDVPLELFLNSCHKGRSPYWQNKTAAALAKQLGRHSRTIVRRARRFNIPRGELKPLDEALIKCKLREYSPRVPRVVLVEPPKSEGEVVIDLMETLETRYKLRLVGKTVEVTIPRLPMERDARVLGLSTKEFMNRYAAVWHYDGFPGLYLTFQEKKRGG